MNIKRILPVILLLNNNIFGAADIERSVFKPIPNAQEYTKNLICNNCSQSDLNIEISTITTIMDPNGRPIQQSETHTIFIEAGKNKNLNIKHNNIVNQNFSKKIYVSVYTGTKSRESSPTSYSTLSAVYNSVSTSVAKYLQKCEIDIDEKHIKKNIAVNIIEGKSSLLIETEFQDDPEVFLENRKSDYFTKFGYKLPIYNFFVSLFNKIKDGPNSELNKELRSKNISIFLLQNSNQLKFLETVERGLDNYIGIFSNDIYNKLNHVKDVKSLLAFKRDLIWFLYAFAIAKNQYFNEGMIILEDPEYKIYQFLIANCNGHFPNTNQPPRFSTRHFGSYLDLINHNIENSEDFEQVYMEIEGLPCNMPHVLFGKLDHNKIFIKLLDYGYSSYWKIVSTAHDTTFHKKEHISADLLNEYVTELKNLNIKNIDVLKKEASIRGIHYMIENLIVCFDGHYDSLLTFLENELENFPSYYETFIQELTVNITKNQEKPLTSAQKKTASFIVKLLDTYDNTHLRVGNEVIISYEELKSFLL